MRGIVHPRSIATVAKLLGAQILLLIGQQPISAQVILHNEAIDGDLSNNRLAPVPFALGPGSSNIIGSVSSADTQDWLSVTVPAGQQLNSMVHVAYLSTDVQGFTGFANGATFAGDPFTPASYSGYAHFGTAATNGSLPPADTRGSNMLAIMADPNAYLAGQQPQGVALPLGPGTYTFLYQQLGAVTDYEFSFLVSTVPEPASLLLTSFGLAALSVRRHSRRGSR